MSGVTALEIAWTSIAVTAFIFSIWLVFGGWNDFVAVRDAVRATPPRARVWGPRWWIALSAFVANMILTVVWLIFIVVGVLAMTTRPDSNPLYQAWVASITGWLLIVGFSLIALVQAWHLFVRNRVNRASRGRL